MHADMLKVVMCESSISNIKKPTFFIMSEIVTTTNTGQTIQLLSAHLDKNEMSPAGQLLYRL